MTPWAVATILVFSAVRVPTVLGRLIPSEMIHRSLSHLRMLLLHSTVLWRLVKTEKNTKLLPTYLFGYLQ